MDTGNDRSCVDVGVIAQVRVLAAQCQLVRKNERMCAPIRSAPMRSSRNAAIAAIRSHVRHGRAAESLNSDIDRVVK